MAISIYTRAPKESSFNLDIDKQMNQYTNVYRYEQERKRQEQKERESTYLKMANVDPIYTVSSYWQQKQGEAINEFHDYLAQKYYNSQNKPSLQDLIDIQNHKQALYSWQQNLKADQARYEQAVKAIESDPMGTKYDVNNFTEKVNNWMSLKGAGKLDEDLLLPPLIPDLKSHNIAKKYTGKMQKNVIDKGGVRTITEDMGEDKRKAMVIEDLHKNPSELRTALKGFSELPEQEKQNWLAKYPNGQSDKAITDWYYDNYGKYAYPKLVDTQPAPKGRSGYGSGQITGMVNYDNPSDSITINPTGTKDEQVDVWGGYTLPGSITGVVTARDYIDMSTGQKQKVEPGNDIVIKYPEIKYVPVYKEGIGWGEYRYNSGQIKGGYKIKPLLITRPEEGTSIGLELTPELKDKLKTKFPRLASEIDKIPMEVNPKNKQEVGDVKLPKTRTFTIKNKSYTFDDLLKAGYSEKQIQAAIDAGKLK